MCNNYVLTSNKINIGHLTQTEVWTETWSSSTSSTFVQSPWTETSPVLMLRKSSTLQNGFANFTNSGTCFSLRFKPIQNSVFGRQYILTSPLFSHKPLPPVCWEPQGRLRGCGRLSDRLDVGSDPLLHMDEIVQVLCEIKHGRPILIHHGVNIHLLVHERAAYLGRGGAGM